MPPDSVWSVSTDEDMRCFSKQCGLCYQAFVEDDDIIIGYQRPTRIKYAKYGMELPNSGDYLACGGCERSGEILFRGSHLGCFNLIPSKAYLALLHITERSFEIDLPKSREQRLRDEAASRLVTTLRQPLDITTEIAHYLTQEYSVAFLTYLHPIRRPGHIHLDVSTPIMLHESQFEGKFYLSFASNAEGPRYQHRPRFLFLSEDEFGITGLHVTASESPPAVTTLPGVWWKTVILREDEYMIKLYHDGFKFRSLNYRGRNTRNLTLWSVPQISRFLRSPSWSRFIGPHGPMRMLSFSYNFAEMTDLSVRCGCGPAAWFAHTADDDLSCYATDTSIHPVWIYVPLHNERITKMWKRHSLMSFDLAFAFETDQWRCFVIGGQGTQWHLESAWSLLDVPASNPGTFFFEWHRGAARKLSFTTTAPRRTTTAPPLPRHLSTRPMSMANEIYYWSYASLEGITSLRQCQRMNCVGCSRSLACCSSTTPGQWQRWDRFAWIH